MQSSRTNRSAVSRRHPGQQLGPATQPARRAGHLRTSLATPTAQLSADAPSSSPVSAAPRTLTGAPALSVTEDDPVSAYDQYFAAVHLYRAIVDAVEKASTPKHVPPTAVGTDAAGSEWLAQNKKRTSVRTLPSGLQYRVLKAANKVSPSPKRDTECEVHYRGKLLDGTEFDSSYHRHQPVRISPDRVMQAWTIALQLMGQGDIWELFVPSELAYGDAGRTDPKHGPSIPPGAVLIFDLELVRVKGPSKPKPLRPPDPPAAGTPYVPEATFQGQLPGYIFTTRSPLVLDDLSSTPPRNEPSVLPTGSGTPKLTPDKAGWATGTHVGVTTPASSSGLFEREPLSSTRTPHHSHRSHRTPHSGLPTATTKTQGFSDKSPVTSLALPPPPPTLAGQDGTHISLAQIGSLREQLSHFEALAETQRKQAQVEEVALGVLHSMLCRLQLPTLQQALRDLGMPAEGGKSELTSRLAGAMQEDLILPPR